jgi:hypothetical protein
MHQTTAGSSSLTTAPILFLELLSVLVTRPLQQQQLGMIPLLRRMLVRCDAPLTELCAGLIAEKVRINLYRLHAEFAPSYVLSGLVAERMQRGEMACLLRLSGLGFVADNLHANWRTEPDPSGARADQISRWLAAHTEVQSGFVILDSVDTGADLPRSPLAGSSVMCPPTRGLTTPALNRARMLLRRAAAADGLGGVRDAAA